MCSSHASHWSILSLKVCHRYAQSRLDINQEREEFRQRETETETERERETETETETETDRQTEREGGREGGRERGGEGWREIFVKSCFPAVSSSVQSNGVIEA